MYPYDPNTPPADGTPPPAPRKRHHYIRWTLIGFGALILLIIVIGVAVGPGKRTPAAAPQQSTSAPAAATTQPAAPAVAATTPTASPPTTVTFTVTGTGDPSITYGTDSDNRDGGGTAGTLGDGNTLPWTRSLSFDGTAQYYFIDAQLEGTGDISCKIVVTGPGDQPLTVSSGHAAGSYNICSAQAAPSDSTGTSWQNER